MKVTIRRAHLVEALDLLKELCPLRFRELERGVLITVSGSSVTLEVTDDVHWGKVTIDRVAIEEEGIVSTDPRILSDLVRKMEADEVELLKEKRGLVVRATDSKYRLRLFDPDLHPTFPLFPDTFTHTIERRALSLLIDRVAIVAQADRSLEDKPSGIWLRTDSGKLRLYSTDKIRFIHGSVSVTTNSPDMPPVLLSPQSLKRVASVSLLAGADVNIKVDYNCIYIRCGNTLFRSPPYEGKFSGFYNDLEGFPVPANRIEVDSTVLSEAVSRLLLVASISAHNPIAFHAQSASCLLTTETEAGDAEEKVGSTRLAGENFRVHLNGRILSDVLTKMKAPKFIIASDSGRLALCLIPTDQPDLRVWILPIKS
jgi:DNA polymerase III sliding clamp (beta) subunit (PCNA family)